VTYYADYLEEDLGVTITVNNQAASGSRTNELLMSLQWDGVLRDAISEAEVITIWIGWNDMWYFVPNRFANNQCANGQNLDLDCVREGASKLVANIDAILGEIVSLRSTNDTLIRIVDECNVLVKEWQEAGVFEEVKGPGFEEWSQGIVNAAAKYGIPVVHTYAALNGPRGDEPVPAELLLADGIHFTAEGHILVADLHRELGYEYGGP
jgi:lysophospholipase L1-like esterase